MTGRDVTPRSKSTGKRKRRNDLELSAAKKPLAYVAGPITGDPFGCVRQAASAFTILRDVGCIPFLPQLSIIHEMVAPQPYETWLEYDFDVIARCDLLVRLPGESPGADREVEYANSLGIPVVPLSQTELDRGEPASDFALYLAALLPRNTARSTHLTHTRTPQTRTGNQL